jgi:hypothetical protein
MEARHAYHFRRNFFGVVAGGFGQLEDFWGGDPCFIGDRDHPLYREGPFQSRLSFCFG